VITVSIAICTRDRADSLRRTLASVSRSRAALPRELAGAWELLVVDNGSLDHTAAVARAHADALPLTLVSEPRTGLSNARNAAIAHFRGEWIAFTDDDAEVEERYLPALLQAIEAKPGMDFFGGRVRVKWTAGTPAWLGDPDLPFIKGLLCSFDEGAQDRELPPDLLPFGVNMGMRRALVEGLAPFRADLGPGSPARGEETEYLRRAVAQGYRGFYLGSVGVWHRADPTRFGVAALYRHGIAKGLGHRIMDPSAAGPGSLRREAWQLLAAVWQALKGKRDWMRVCIVNAGMERGLRRSTGDVTRRRGP
jgi:glycosyltransferase involved in cell wall biosynthesis